MEGIAAVSLTSNILEFLSFTKDVISGAKEIRRSGARADIAESESQARRLENLANRTVIPNLPIRSQRAESSLDDQTPKDDDKELNAIGEQCIQVSRELLGVFDKIKTKDPRPGHDSFRQALRTRMKKSEIESLQSRLDRLGLELFKQLVPKQIADLQTNLATMHENVNTQNDAVALRLKDDISKLESGLKELSKDIVNENNVSKMSKNARALSRVTDFATNRIMRNLFFATIDQRHLSIDERHAKTLEWIFDKSSPIKFVDWLQNETCLYWISGKAGSGKSTAMKFISESELTQQYLQNWTGASKLVIASFYFWNLGRDDLHKSQSGLLRSLLYQILQQEPALVPLVFPDIWQFLISESEVGPQTLQESRFSVPYLVNAFKIVASHLPSLQTKICFLIDGLDEYEGQTGDLIDLIRALSAAPGLTKDIRLFVRDRLEENDMFADLVELEGEELGTSFIHELVDAAEGVFLWVRLVTQSIRTGLTNADKFSDLFKRLRSFPSDLDEYFDRILFGVDDLYSQQSAIMCSVTLRSATILPLMTYWFIDQDDPNHVITCERGPISSQKTSLILRSTRLRLNAYCKGLIETKNVHHEDRTPFNSSEQLFNNSADFLHRTVRDFLQTSRTKALLSARLPPNFDPDVVIFKATLGQLKVSPPECLPRFGDSSDISAIYDKMTPFKRMMISFEKHSKGLESLASESDEVILLDELNRTLVELPDSSWDESLFDYSNFSLEINSFPVVNLCVSWHLWRYVAYILKNKSMTDRNRVAILRESLELAMHSKTGDEKFSQDQDFIRKFLYDDLVPDLPLADSTAAWNDFLMSARDRFEHGDMEGIVILLNHLRV